MTMTRSIRSRGRRRRDRRGRGVRGLLYPPTLPAARSRAERFDAIVLDALEPIDERWHVELDRLDVAVDEVPEVTDCDPTTVTWGADIVEDGNIPLARLVHEVLVEQVANYLGVDPDVIDGPAEPR